MEHIKETMVDEWFPKPIDSIRICDTPFRTDNAHEKELAESLPIPPDKLGEVEKKCGGKFSAHIGKFLHIEDWSRPDLSCFVI